MSNHGWNSYPTFLVNSWIENDEVSNAYWDIASQRHDVYTLAAMLKIELNDIVDATIPSTGILRELINASISEIDFKELAEALKSAADELNEEDDEDDA